MVVINPGDYNICPAYSGFVYKLVTCIKDVVLWALLQYVTPFITFAANMIGAFITLACIFLGLLIASGRVQNLSKDGLAFVIKASIVSAFVLNFGWMASTMFDIMDWLLSAMSIATFYSSPLCPISSSNMWVRIDCLLEIIIGGFLPGGSLYFGVTGFIVTCLISGPFGLLLGLMGLFLIAYLLMGVAQCVYTFIMACISLALMLCVAPIFVPMLMLNVTKGYFEKWIRLTFGLLIQPAVLFAYMSMLLLAFDVVMYLSPNSIYAAITGAPAVPGSSAPLGSWLATSGKYAEQRVSSFLQHVDPKTQFSATGGTPLLPTTTQTGVFSNMPEWHGSIDWNSGHILEQLSTIRDKSFPVYLQLRAFDFNALATSQGMTQQAYETKLFCAFFLACVVAYILFTLLKHIPYLSSSLAGEFLSSHYVGNLFGAVNPIKKINMDTLRKDMGEGALKAAQSQAKGGK